VESWLCDQVGPAYATLKANPSRAVTADHVRARLAAEHAKARWSTASFSRRRPRNNLRRSSAISPPRHRPTLRHAIPRLSSPTARACTSSLIKDIVPVLGPVREPPCLYRVIHTNPSSVSIRVSVNLHK